MNRMIIIIFSLLISISCGVQKNKIPCYAWLAHDKKLDDNHLKMRLSKLKKLGIDTVLYNAGHDSLIYAKVSSLAKETGLGFFAWIPTMVQEPNEFLTKELYAVNRNGESAFDKPAYVAYYKFLCPARNSVFRFLEDLYMKIACIPNVDGIHLDYIRFPDVILAKGLWKKYGLVMDKEYPAYDYCYCDSCVSEFKRETGIEILKIEDPSGIVEWKQFRYNLITNLVNRLAESIHNQHKQINAAVFPGPNSVARPLVRQEWQNWNLDAFFPMNYNDFYLEDTKWIGDVCRESSETLMHKNKFYSGLFIRPEIVGNSENTDPENMGLTAEELHEAIHESMENGATGICIFTPDRMTNKHWKVLKKSIFSKTNLGR